MVRIRAAVAPRAARVVAHLEGHVARKVVVVGATGLRLVAWGADTRRRGAALPLALDPRATRRARAFYVRAKLGQAHPFPDARADAYAILPRPARKRARRRIGGVVAASVGAAHPFHSTLHSILVAETSGGVDGCIVVRRVHRRAAFRLKVKVVPKAELVGLAVPLTLLFGHADERANDIVKLALERQHLQTTDEGTDLIVSRGFVALGRLAHRAYSREQAAARAVSIAAVAVVGTKWAPVAPRPGATVVAQPVLGVVDEPHDAAVAVRSRAHDRHAEGRRRRRRRAGRRRGWRWGRRQWRQTGRRIGWRVRWRGRRGWEQVDDRAVQPVVLRANVEQHPRVLVVGRDARRVARRVKGTAVGAVDERVLGVLLQPPAAASARWGARWGARRRRRQLSKPAVVHGRQRRVKRGGYGHAAIVHRRGRRDDLPVPLAWVHVVLHQDEEDVGLRVEDLEAQAVDANVQLVGRRGVSQRGHAPVVWRELSRAGEDAIVHGCKLEQTLLRGTPLDLEQHVPRHLVVDRSELPRQCLVKRQHLQREPVVDVRVVGRDALDVDGDLLPSPVAAVVAVNPALGLQTKPASGAVARLPLHVDDRVVDAAAAVPPPVLDAPPPLAAAHRRMKRRAGGHLLHRVVELRLLAVGRVVDGVG